MKGRLRLPSPALVISMLALSLVLGGSAFAATTATAHSDAAADTRLVKKLAPKLTVKAAKVAALAGAALVAGRVLPLSSGQTESGDYSVSGSGNGSFMSEGIQFAIPLAHSIDVSHIGFVLSGTSTTGCPGVGKAAAGFLCVYEEQFQNRSLAGAFPHDHSGAPGADAYGFNLDLGATGPNAFSFGSWTVKAP